MMCSRQAMKGKQLQWSMACRYQRPCSQRRSVLHSLQPRHSTDMIFNAFSHCTYEHQWQSVLLCTLASGHFSITPVLICSL